MNQEIYINEADAKEIFADEELDYDPSLLVSDSVKMYLNQINEIPLLSYEEEQKLGARIAKGDHEAMNSLIEHNLRLVVSIAKRYCGCGLSLMDLIQEGNIGLMKAAEKYDVSRGFRFSTLATWWVRQAISRALTNNSRAIRLPANVTELVSKIKRANNALSQQFEREPTAQEIADYLKVEVEKVEIAIASMGTISSIDVALGEDEETTIGDMIIDDGAEDMLKNIIKEENRQMIEHIFDTLPEKEAGILRMRFGLTGEAPKTLEEIGGVYGVSKERIRQLETKALRKMRHPMRAKMLREAMSEDAVFY